MGPLLSVPLLSAVFGTEVWCTQVLGMVGVWLCINNIYVCMYVYICMCVCMYVYMYVYMYIHIYVYMCVTVYNINTGVILNERRVLYSLKLYSFMF